MLSRASSTRAAKGTSPERTIRAIQSEPSTVSLPRSTMSPSRAVSGAVW
jgi:hypothetical protein